MALNNSIEDIKSNICHCFLKKKVELTSAGTLNQAKNYLFKFEEFDKPAESYTGEFGRIR